MPISYEVDEERGIVLSTLSGRVTVSEFLTTAHEGMEDARIKSGYSHLIDMDEVQSADIPSDVISSVAHATRTTGFLMDGKTAIVACQDFMYALGRMYQTYSSAKGRSIQVFRDRQEACRWLGIAGELQS